MDLSPQAILSAAGSEVETLGGVLYIVYPRGESPSPSNLKVIPELEFDSKIHNFYSMVLQQDPTPNLDAMTNKTQVGIMAFEKKTLRARSGTKGGASGHLYKTLNQARAAVGRRNKVEDYHFLPAFVDMPTR